MLREDPRVTVLERVNARALDPAPASLSTLRALVTRVRADVIATLVQDGGFRTVEDGLTMHIREKAPDGCSATFSSATTATPASRCNTPPRTGCSWSGPAAPSSSCRTAT